MTAGTGSQRGREKKWCRLQTDGSAPGVGTEGTGMGMKEG